jgi:hypothetical protein
MTDHTQRLSVRLVMIWALCGAAVAGVICGPVVLPALWQASRAAAAAGSGAITWSPVERALVLTVAAGNLCDVQRPLFAVADLVD